MKYLLSISYDGSKYCGLQKLNNQKTVQGELEQILSLLSKSPVVVKAAGRTDRGVHALDQKCHFELKRVMTPFRLRYYINRCTSPYLHVNSCTVIEDKNFHARFSVKSKIYIYKINMGAYDAIQNDYVYNYNRPLDVEVMRKASELLVGAHDYRAFVSGKKDKCESIIEYIEIIRNGQILEIEVKGKAFYTHMIRNIVGALIYVASGRMTEVELKNMLETGRRIVEYMKVPPCGLYLKKVEY